MECWCVSKHKSWLYWLSVLMLIPILMVQQILGGCIEEERKALLEIKASLVDSFDSNWDSHLVTWVDHGSIGGRNSGECCDWERVKCNTTTGHVTHLSLSNMMGMTYKDLERIWPLNVSIFLHFKELRSLNLSFNYLDNGIVRTGLEMLSSLKKLKILDISRNRIDNDIFPSLGALTSLRVLHLGENKLEGYFPALGLENLEILDLTNCGSDGLMRGFGRVSSLRKLKILNLGCNRFNESLITSLKALPLLKALDLSANDLYGAFPAQEFAHLSNLETLDLSWNSLDGTPSIQDCKRLSGLKKLESISLGVNWFNKSIISCLSVLPFLKTLDLSNSYGFGSFLSIQELSGFRELETLDLSDCGLDSITLNDLSHLPDLKVLILRDNFFSGTLALLMEALASFHRLEVLDLSWNHLVGSIPSTIHALSSLRVVSFANNKLNDSLSDHGLCELRNLHELDLSGNMFNGSLPQCFNNLSSLKVLDISSNQFMGMLMPSLIANLTSLEYVDFRNNTFEGSFSFSSFSNHTKLEAVGFICDNDKFEVDTEEPIGWIPMFQLKFLVLSSCNLNRHKGSVVPRFLLHQRKLRVLDLAHNSLVGKFPNWLIENNTMLKALNLRNNSFSSIISMSYRNANTRWVDMSANHMIGTIQADIQKFLPYVAQLNLSKNSLDGAIPSSIADMSELSVLDLSDNEFSGEVPKGLFTKLFDLRVLKLSNNRLQGHVLSGNLSLGNIKWLHLDSNSFTGKIGNGDIKTHALELLDISNNYFTGMIPHWISNTSTLSELAVRNNNLEGRFPCGTASFSFLDISQNSFSGPIPCCLNWQYMKHLHLGSNRCTGSIPNAFRNLTDVLTLDIGNNNLSGRVPEFLGELSKIRILVLRKNNFSGSIPKQLCQLSDVSLMDLSSNSLSYSIPRCLHNITSPVYHAFIRSGIFFELSFYNYQSVLKDLPSTYYDRKVLEIEDEVQFTTKYLSLSYKGNSLDYMTGLDLSCNKLTGEIPKELGLLTRVHVLNLSHNQLVGPIPLNFSYLTNIESLDLSSNALSGELPAQLINLCFLSKFNVSHNNLSGRLPEMKAQFSTFTKESYEGNPLLCGPPLEKKCTTTSQVTASLAKEDTDKWYDIDMACFYGSSGSTWAVFLLGFVAVLYTNPHWRRRWLDFVEECMYTCYYFLDDLASKLSMLFRK